MGAEVGVGTALHLTTTLYLHSQDLCPAPPSTSRTPFLGFIESVKMAGSILLLPLTFLFFSWGSLKVHAAQGNQSCSSSTQRLQLGTYQFTSDCDAMWWCNSSSICDWKGCRKDEFPFGYWDNVTMPDGCPRGFFCPDEEDSCQPLLAVGSPCQLNRDGTSGRHA